MAADTTGSRIGNLQPTHSSSPAGGRDLSLDAARGLIVALMALDHVRIFFSEAQFNPVDLDQTTFGYFLTRWVTHLCAPGFFFIAGMGASLMAGKAGKARVARFLVVRGVWLIALELLVFGFAWSFNPGWSWLGVIWSLGASMIVMAGLIFVPRLLLLVVAAAFAAGHNAISVNEPGPLVTVLYSGGFAQLPVLGPKIVLYSIVPWLALMALGYAATPWLAPQGKPSSRRLLVVGATALAAFAVARLAGVGQSAWNGFTAYPEFWRTLSSFLNVDKYPPSLQFSLLMLGLMAVFLAYAAAPRNRRGLVEICAVYGRVPFFFYAIHLFLIHGAALALATALGWPHEQLVWKGVGPNLTPPDGYGLPLIGVYAAWFAVLLALYPACTWFGAVKDRSRLWWIRFL
ncbi:MAG: heparan-alpha-glucosaminide N-acetyltransferase domain-containing protein [Pseudomonadota bacterium]|nr:heparan-alpha-glucosaminide N-acetyltransferase domain-containing protein [Pseudomonadota bacterium]